MWLSLFYFLFTFFYDFRIQTPHLIDQIWALIVLHMWVIAETLVILKKLVAVYVVQSLVLFCLLLHSLCSSTTRYAWFRYLFNIHCKIKKNYCDLKSDFFNNLYNIIFLQDIQILTINVAIKYVKCCEMLCSDQIIDIA